MMMRACKYKSKCTFMLTQGDCLFSHSSKQIEQINWRKQNFPDLCHFGKDCIKKHCQRDHDLSIFLQEWEQEQKSKEIKQINFKANKLKKQQLKSQKKQIKQLNSLLLNNDKYFKVQQNSKPIIPTNQQQQFPQICFVYKKESIKQNKQNKLQILKPNTANNFNNQTYCILKDQNQPNHQKQFTNAKINQSNQNTRIQIDELKQNSDNSQNKSISNQEAQSIEKLIEKNVDKQDNQRMNQKQSSDSKINILKTQILHLNKTNRQNRLIKDINATPKSKYESKPDSARTAFSCAQIKNQFQRDCQMLNNQLAISLRNFLRKNSQQNLKIKILNGQLLLVFQSKLFRKKLVIIKQNLFSQLYNRFGADRSRMIHRNRNTNNIQQKIIKLFTGLMNLFKQYLEQTIKDKLLSIEGRMGISKITFQNLKDLLYPEKQNCMIEPLFIGGFKCLSMCFFRRIVKIFLSNIDFFIYKDLISRVKTHDQFQDNVRKYCQGLTKELDKYQQRFDGYKSIKFQIRKYDKRRQQYFNKSIIGEQRNYKNENQLEFELKNSIFIDLCMHLEQFRKRKIIQKSIKTFSEQSQTKFFKQFIQYKYSVSTIVPESLPVEYKYKAQSILATGKLKNIQPQILLAKNQFGVFVNKKINEVSLSMIKNKKISSFQNKNGQTKFHLFWDGSFIVTAKSQEDIYEIQSGILSTKNQDINRLKITKIVENTKEQKKELYHLEILSTQITYTCFLKQNFKFNQLQKIQSLDIYQRKQNLYNSNRYKIYKYRISDRNLSLKKKMIECHIFAKGFVRVYNAPNIDILEECLHNLQAGIKRFYEPKQNQIEFEENNQKIQRVQQVIKAKYKSQKFIIIVQIEPRSKILETLCKQICDIKQYRNQNLQIKKQKLSLLTWNVWGNLIGSKVQCQKQERKISRVQRIKSIIQTIKTVNADIVCLQQVNKIKFELKAGLSMSYYFPQLTQSSQYDTMILMKFPIRYFKISYQGFYKGDNGSWNSTNNAMCQFKLTNTDKNITKTVLIHSIHLRSSAIRYATDPKDQAEYLQNCSNFRYKQLELLERVDKNFDIVIAAGDFNFSPKSKGKENQKIQANYRNIQTQRDFPENQQFTYLNKGRHGGQQLDKILIRLKNLEEGNLKQQQESIKILDFNIIGKYSLLEGQNVDQVKYDGIVRSPSDHFGLYTQIGFNF